MKTLQLMSILTLLGLASCGNAQQKSFDEAVALRAARYEVETFQTKSGKPIGITLIKHGSLEIFYDGLSIQVDPVSGLGKPTDYAAEFPKADFILVTHEHGDHYNPEVIKDLSKEDTRVITTERIHDMLGYGEVLSNGRVTTAGKGITIEAVPAYNTTEGREQFHPRGNGNGYLLTIGGLRILISGDSEDIVEYSFLEDIDVAFLSANQPYTMTLEQCIHAAQTIKPKVLIPYHLGNTDMQAIKDGLEGSGIDVRLHESLR